MIKSELTKENKLDVQNDIKHIDWQQTQNDLYLSLLRDRLSEPPLVWCTQFMKLIEQHLSSDINSRPNPIRLNDFGCNVGHFFRVCASSKFDFKYRGYDISDTYLEIARSNFGNLNSASFDLLDVSRPEAKQNIEVAEISVISATLEHINDYEVALSNIFLSTKNLVLIRTFVGDESRKDYCLTSGAKNKYLIRQFTIEQLTDIPQSAGWKCVEYIDHATHGVGKYVCNGVSIFRTQRIFVYTKEL